MGSSSHLNKHAAERQRSGKQEHSREGQAPVFLRNESGHDADAAGRLVVGGAVAAENSSSKSERARYEKPERQNDNHGAEGNGSKAPAVKGVN